RLCDRRNEVGEVREPVGGIVLAAGAAQRYGQAKVLLSWHGQPFVRQVAQTALSAGLDPVCVVAGAYYEEIRDAVQGLPVQVIENPDWEMGQSSSLRAGLACLPRRCGAAAFLLADQPQIAAGPIQQLVDLHAATLAPIVAPRVDGRRANPVLFDRATFHELALLTGDTGGRELFARYPVQWMDSTDRRLLFDVDTPADYEALQGMETDSE
ncbi:MAG TPA: nucleotidyltransferase family protein, partial [Anaerolineaceae bacterium]|nr:nucleotidyltransferase family protein [Anaerolineaceae bacterium]